MLTAARSAAQDAATLAEAFIAHAIPEDFLGNLETSIDNFQQAREEYASAKRASHYTGEQIEAMTQETREVAKRLDAIVRNALSGDGATFAVWKRSCQFGQSRSRRPGVTEVPGAWGNRRVGIRAGIGDVDVIGRVSDVSDTDRRVAADVADGFRGFVAPVRSGGWAISGQRSARSLERAECSALGWWEAVGCQRSAGSSGARGRAATR